MPFSSNIANELLWTPFDNKSINSHKLFDNIEEEVFLKKCFSKPFFQMSFPPKADGVLFVDSPMTIDDFKTFIDEESDKYIVFKNWLTMFENHKVYTLSGNSGTGKTTFLHNLKRKQTQYYWTILDVSTAPEKFDWFGDIYTEIKKHERATRKTLTAIINEIHALLFDVKSDINKVNKIYNNLSEITDKYKIRFKRQFIAGHTIFDNLCVIFDKELNEEETVIESAKLFAKYFQNGVHDDDYALLDKAMDVLIILLRCKNSDVNKKMIIAFDNFERFVTEDEIYNNEINRIRKKLANYDIRINKKNNHDSSVKFIMTMRCSTARICGIKLHQADENPSNIDISSWFQINDILQRKIDWFDEMQITSDNFKLIQQISGDLRQCKNGDLTGVQLFLDPLFNHNKRLLIDFLGIMIENKANKEKYNYTQYIKDYEEIWKKDTDIARCAARNIIKGLVLYKLKHTDDLFKKMKATSENDDNDNEEQKLGSGLARKILTIIFNKSVKSNDEILLSDVIGELYSAYDILSNWRKDNYSKKRKAIADVLFHMASYNRRDNDWIQMIDLQYEDEKQKRRIRNEREMEKILYDDFEKLYITIMPAGVTYLQYIVPSFEYFSIRYNKKYQPLFSSLPSVATMENVKNVEELQCYILIKNVHRNALRCINKIKDNNMKICFKTSNLTHQERIINFHQFYLDNFNKYIKEVIITDKEMSDKARANYLLLIDKVNEIKKEYK